MIKMIVTDLDGTLLNDNKKVSDMTKNYLKKLKSKGYIIVIATGRTYASALSATDGAEFANYIITDNGACIYKTGDSKIIFGNFINKDLTLKVLNYCIDICYVTICSKNYIYSNDIEINKLFEKKDDIEKISHLVVSIKEQDKFMNIYSDFCNKFKDLEIIIMKDYFSSNKWMDIMAKGTSKYNSINILANHLNINNNKIIAFGDGLNDIEMIEKCGHGVALINAFQDVKDKSNDITKFSNNDDGVINYLEKYLNVSI